jgi:hypothetical protein
MMFSLDQDEMRRRLAMLHASPDFDATTALADEAEAYRLLYSNLDAHQQSIFDDLKAAGVL